MGQEEGSHHHSFRTMDEDMMHKFLLPHTKDAPIRQIPPSILKIVEGKNFIQKTISNEESHFRWNIHLPKSFYKEPNS